MILMEQSARFSKSSPVTFDMLRLIEEAGRNCYQSVEKHEEQMKKLLANGPLSKSAAEGVGCFDEVRADRKVTQDFVKLQILDTGHHAMFEHSVVTVDIVCNRGVSHELVRHRIAAYAQESTRWVNYGSKGHCRFIVPPQCRAVFPVGEYERDIDVREQDSLQSLRPSMSRADEEWFNAMIDAECVYMKLLEEGWKPQQARDVLPNATKTEVYATYNLRQWRHVLAQRTGAQMYDEITGKKHNNRPHPQMIEVMKMVLCLFKQSPIGMLFEDINP